MLSRYLVGGRLDPPFYPTKTKPCIASRRIDIVAISIKADIITPTDYWSLVVDENLIVNHVYCKDYSERRWWTRYDAGEDAYKPPVSKDTLLKFKQLEQALADESDCNLARVEIHLKDFTNYHYTDPEETQ